MAWFESVAEAERRARRTLPRSVFKAIHAGTERGLTLADNVAAFSELGFAPHVAGLSRERATCRRRVMGVEISLPVLLSPTGVQAVHPDGELAVARAAAARGTAMGLSGFASTAVEEVVAACPKTFAQLYWAGSREAIEARVDRARSAGCGRAHRHARLDVLALARLGLAGDPAGDGRCARSRASRPEALARPRWLARWARAGHLPRLSVPNVAGDPGFFAAYGEWMGTPPPSWEDLAGCAELWDGPFMLKGVMRVDDARRAVDDVGATRALGLQPRRQQPRRDAGDDPGAGRDRRRPWATRCEVLLDGGVRRGGDVVKALALGARAVMIGRPYLWGLAADGQAGVENVLDVLRSGIDSALLGLGHASVSSLSPSDLLIPDGFARRLGV